MIGPPDSADSTTRGEQSINPYLAPVSATPPGQRADQRSPLGTTWSGRHSLLRSILFMRFSAVVGAVLWSRSLVTWLSRPFEVFLEFGAEGLRSILLSPTILIPGILAVATAIVCMYLNLLLWKYAQHVKDGAAGRRSDADVCEAHLRFWRIYAAAMLLLVANDMVAAVFQWQAGAAPNPGPP